MKGILHHFEIGFQGELYLFDGGHLLGRLNFHADKLVACQFGSLKGLSALRSLCLYPKRESIKFTEEKNKERSSEFSLTEKEFQVFYKHTQKINRIAKKFKPPMQAHFSINPQKLYADTEKKFSQIEFDVLSSILDHKSIRQIYQDSRFSEDELTIALMGLKKNQLIRLAR